MADCINCYLDESSCNYCEKMRRETPPEYYWLYPDFSEFFREYYKDVKLPEANLLYEEAAESEIWSQELLDLIKPNSEVTPPN